MHAALGTFPLRHGSFQQDHFRAKILSLIYAFQNHQPMNRTLLVPISLFALSSLVAQPTLVSPGNAPTPGTSVLTNYAPAATPGTAGASQTWDFSNLVADSSAYTFVEDPAATPGAADFPNATAAVVAQDGTQYFEASSSLVELVGPSLLGQTAPLTNPASFLPFPCTYQTSWEDDFAGSIDLMGFALEVTGDVVAIADGYGTLILPEATVNNVLRIRRITTTLITTPFGGGQIEEEVFAFYQVGLGLPILEISSTTGDLPVLGVIDISTLKWVNVTNVGVGELASDPIGVSVFPNPATDNVQINFSLTGGRSVSIELFDLTGRQVSTVNVSTAASGIHTSTMDVSELPSGMYLMRVMDNKGRVGTTRFNVQ